MATPSSSPFGQTGNDVLDVLTNGFYWSLDSTRTIAWSISKGSLNETWPSPDFYIDIFDELFSRFEYYINVDFTFVGYFNSPSLAYANNSDINLSIDSFLIDTYLGPQVAAVAFFPNVDFTKAALEGFYYGGAEGDIYFNVNHWVYDFSHLPGGEVFSIAMHEVGHALGLKHPHDDGGTGRPTADQRNLAGFDIDYATIMSYEDDDALAGLFQLFEPQTPMGLDVLALQFLYGPNPSTNAGDSIFTLPLNNTYLTIWDAEGRDLIDLGSHTRSWYIELPYDFDLDTRTQKLGVALPRDELSLEFPRNLYWLTGDIEDIHGSSFDDVLHGNESNNLLAGNGGNDGINGWEGSDLLEGGEGNDTLIGGAGQDTASFAGNKADFLLSSNGDSGYLVEDLSPGDFDSGSDALDQIEILSFEDGQTVLYQDSDNLRFHHNGHTYRVVLTAMTWQESREYAESQDGHLVTISSPGENQALFEYLQSLDIDEQSPIALDGGDAPYVWLGATDQDEEGSWVWVDDGTLDVYSNWGEGPEGQEPNNFENRQHALAMGLEAWPQPGGGVGEAGEWNDLDESNVLYAVIEWDEYIPINYEPEGLILLHGDAAPGEIILAETGSISDANGLSGFNYQWLNNGEVIEGATSNTYQITQDDVGDLINVSVTYTDGEGFDEIITSEARLPVEPTSTSFTNLIEMYVIILGRAPDGSGLEFWNDKINDGRTFEDVAAAMWDSPGAQEAYPPILSAEEKVATVYTNVLSREPDEGGLQFWLAKWEDPDVGPVDTMLRMINALSANNSDDPQAVADKILFEAKVDIGGYLATIAQSDNVDIAAQAFDYLEEGNSLEATVSFVNQQLGVIGQSSVETGDDLMA